MVGVADVNNAGNAVTYLLLQVHPSMYIILTYCYKYIYLCILYLPTGIHPYVLTK